jgi:hypothetical protein
MRQFMKGTKMRVIAKRRAHTTGNIKRFKLSKGRKRSKAILNTATSAHLCKAKGITSVKATARAPNARRVLFSDFMCAPVTFGATLKTRHGRTRDAGTDLAIAAFSDIKLLQIGKMTKTR